MKILKRILLVISIIFVVLFIAGYILVAIFAKNIAQDQIQQQLKVKADIKSLSLSLPLSLTIKGLSIGEFLSVEKIEISPSLIGLLAGKIILNSVTLISPDIRIERKKDGSFNLPELPKNEGEPPIIAGVFVKNGSLTFIDKNISSDGLLIPVKNINAKVYKSSLLPYPLTIKYTLEALIPPRAGMKETIINGSGWIDLTKKNMDGNFAISDIDLMLFKQYLTAFVVLPEQTSAAKPATANFKADLSAKNNDLSIQCVLTKNPGGETMFDFSLHTQLDNPQLNMQSLQANVFQNIIEKAIKDPEKTINAIKDIGEQFKGKDLEKTFKAIFKKSSEE